MPKKGSVIRFQLQYERLLIAYASAESVMMKDVISVLLAAYDNPLNTIWYFCGRA
jgi:hypothetical protein